MQWKWLCGRHAKQRNHPACIGCWYVELRQTTVVACKDRFGNPWSPLWRSSYLLPLIIFICLATVAERIEEKHFPLSPSSHQFFLKISFGKKSKNGEERAAFQQIYWKKYKSDKRDPGEEACSKFAPVDGRWRRLASVVRVIEVFTVGGVEVTSSYRKQFLLSLFYFSERPVLFIPADSVRTDSSLLSKVWLGFFPHIISFDT